MKKFLFCILHGIFLVLLLYFVFPSDYVKDTVSLYMFLYHRPCNTYVVCQDILNQAVSKNTVYTDVQKYMSKDIYNRLSVKTKFYYREEQYWDEKIHVISQKQDEKDKRLFYIDFIEYSTKKEFTKWIRMRRVIIFLDGTCWKIIKYIEPLDYWHEPIYIETVYSFILP